MTLHVRKAIEELEMQLQEQLSKVSDTKKAINTLCTVLGEGPRYSDVALEKTGSLNIKPDQFFGKPLAGAVRSFLEMKGSAATVDEIHSSLKKGGYDFSGKDQQKNLRISLTKNSTTFAYLKGSDTFGLWDFYGGRPKQGITSSSKKVLDEIIDSQSPQEDLTEDIDEK